MFDRTWDSAILGTLHLQSPGTLQTPREGASSATTWRFSVLDHVLTRWPVRRDRNRDEERGLVKGALAGVLPETA